MQNHLSKIYLYKVNTGTFSLIIPAENIIFHAKKFNPTASICSQDPQCFLGVSRIIIEYSGFSCSIIYKSNPFYVIALLL